MDNVRVEGHITMSLNNNNQYKNMTVSEIVKLMTQLNYEISIKEKALRERESKFLNDDDDEGIITNISYKNDLLDEISILQKQITQLDMRMIKLEDQLEETYPTSIECKRLSLEM